MAEKVAGELYEKVTGQLFEIGRQLRQLNGYPYNPHQLKTALQELIEGNFGSLGRTQGGVLKFVSTVEVGDEPVVSPKDVYRPNTEIDGVKIGWVGPRFKRWVLSDDNLKYVQSSAHILRVHEIRRQTKLPYVLGDLGSACHSDLWQIWELLKLDAIDKIRSPLSRKNGGNHFLLPTESEILCWVNVYEARGRWNIGAHTMLCDHDLGAGEIVFSE